MGLLETVRKEEPVIKRAPFSFFVFLVAGATIGYLGSAWYYSKQITDKDATITAKDGEIGRYRVALGIDKASAGALIALTNQELRQKALGTAANLRATCLSFRDRNQTLQNQLAVSKLGEEEKSKRSFALLKEESDEFDQTTRTDTSIVEIELRRRLSPEAKASIVGLPPAFQASDGAILTLLSMMGTGSGTDATLICRLADSIEQLAKLLPE